jgi:hypothetical protein
MPVADFSKISNITASSSSGPASRYSSLIWLLVLSALSIALWDVPWAKGILFPVRTFVTAVHEIGHAVACLATGGAVHGMTIVSDGNGHGGLTFCSGGMPFIYTQAGYLGTALFGCVLIFLGRYPKAAKAVLILMGAAISLASVFFVSQTFGDFSRLLQAVGSFIWAAAIGGGLIWSGLKLKPALANFVLLFLAVQTSLNALTDVVIVVKLSLGMYGFGVDTSSDAGSMAAMTFLPAAFWSLLWGAASVLMLAFTLWYCYGPKSKTKLI